MSKAPNAHGRVVRMPSRGAVPWIVAVCALVLAMGGTGLAAKKYLITSTNQISPSVLAKLHGAAGAPGAPGAPGPQGAAGQPGPQGPPGSVKAYGEVLPGGGGATIIHNVGLPSNGVRLFSTGVWCITVPAGANADEPIGLTLAGGFAGFVAQADRSVCNSTEFQVETGNTAGALVSSLPFNVLVP